MHSDSVDQIKQMIENYRNHIANTQLNNEVYKWKLIEDYKGRPNLDAEDLHVELKSIDYRNLIYHLSKATLNQMTKSNPEEIRKLFVELFDESLDLTKRIKDFTEQTKVLYKRLGEKKPHHQDERAVSAYLTVHNPEKYTFYKYSYYAKYCNLLGIKKRKKNEHAIEAQRFIQFIHKSEEIKSNKYVGVIHFGGRTINLLPKIFFDSGKNYSKEEIAQIHYHILWWLSYCRKIKFPSYNSKLGNTRGDFFEVLIYQYSKYT